MRRADFEHVLGAAAHVVDLDAFVVIGSQAILATAREIPPAMLVSIEVDVYPLEAPERADEIDAALGDGSPFHAAFGYYAHGVGPETAKAPAGWQDCLVEISIPARVSSPRRPRALCLESHDLVLSKCVAGRARDWDYAAEAIRAGLVDPGTLLARIDDLPVDPSSQAHVRTHLESILRRTAPGS